MTDHELHGAINGSKGEKRVVGNLTCQHDTYRTTLTTTVCQCDLNKGGKGDDKYEIQLMDTILFPEGGGQPWDHGTLAVVTPGFKAKVEGEEETDLRSVIPINKVVRRNLEAIHYSPQAIAVGTRVNVSLDFDRRFDHAQQHSGQHLLSAVLDQLGIPTLAWTMGPDLVYIEVPRLPHTKTMEDVEATCNAYIRDNLPITVREMRGETPKTLPADYDAAAGVVRIVSIGGIDQNPCCGTHVRSTCELNSLTILYTSTVRGSNYRIHFVVGNRCGRRLRESYGAVRSVGASLSCGVREVETKVASLQLQLRDAMKRAGKLEAEVVAVEADRLVHQLTTPSESRNGSRSRIGRAFMYRETGGADFLNAVVASIPPPLLLLLPSNQETPTQGRRQTQGQSQADVEDTSTSTSGALCMLVTGTESNGGALLVSGSEALVTAAATRIKERVPSVKGGGRGARYQGKSASLAPSHVEILREICMEVGDA